MVWFFPTLLPPRLDSPWPSDRLSPAEMIYETWSLETHSECQDWTFMLSGVRLWANHPGCILMPRRLLFVYVTNCLCVSQKTLYESRCSCTWRSHATPHGCSAPLTWSSWTSAVMLISVSTHRDFERACIILRYCPSALVSPIYLQRYTKNIWSFNSRI